EEALTIKDLEEYCRPWGVTLEVTKALAFYRIVANARNVATGREDMVGYSTGFTAGELLHLDTVQIRRKNGLLTAPDDVGGATGSSDRSVGDSSGGSNSSAPAAARRDIPWTRVTETGFQLGAVLGCYAMRYGFDRGCRRAELLAINDYDSQHRRLVRYYRIGGFRAVREVGDGVASFGDRLVWGGPGTLMEVDIGTFLRRWAPLMRKATASVATEAAAA
ncbi:unnamed protein product, partial [Phaeothamnion confervicola]